MRVMMIMAMAMRMRFSITTSKVLGQEFLSHNNTSERSLQCTPLAMLRGTGPTGEVCNSLRYEG